MSVCQVLVLLVSKHSYLYLIFFDDSTLSLHNVSNFIGNETPEFGEQHSRVDHLNCVSIATQSAQIPALIIIHYHPIGTARSSLLLQQ